MRGSGGSRSRSPTPTRRTRRAEAIGDAGPAGWRVYFDIVFRDKVDAAGVTYNFSDFEIYVGCGGCAPGGTLILKRTDMAQKDVEPFTQTRYYSIFPPDDPEEPDSLRWSTRCRWRRAPTT